MTTDDKEPQRRTYDQKKEQGIDPRYDPVRDRDLHPDIVVPPGHHLLRPTANRGPVLAKDSFVEEGDIEQEGKVVVVPVAKVLEIQETPEGNMLVLQLEDKQGTVVTMPEKSVAPLGADRKICGAMTRHGPCQSQFVMENGRCRPHGGASTGIKSGHGLYRKKATPELKAIINEIGEANLGALDLLDELVLARAILLQHIEQGHDPYNYILMIGKIVDTVKKYADKLAGAGQGAKQVNQMVVNLLRGDLSESELMDMVQGFRKGGGGDANTNPQIG